MTREGTQDKENKIVEMPPHPLQARYSVKRNGRYVEVPREHLTQEEREEIEELLQRRVASGVAHAAALKAETDQLVKDGVLREDPEGDAGGDQ